MVEPNVVLFIAAFSAIISIVQPFSGAAVFASITKSNTKAERFAIARKATIAAAIILIIFTFLGGYILSFFSITEYAFRIGGGLLVASLGIQMLHSKRQSFKDEKERREAVKREDTSIVPLAMPMLSGPGAMTTVIVLAGEVTSINELGSIIAAIIVVMSIAFLLFIKEAAVLKYLGESGQHILDKIMGLIVLVVGIQFIMNGIHGALQSWGFA